MVQSAYSYIAKTWRDQEYRSTLLKKRLVEWRKSESVVREDKPIRLDRARRVGYKEKRGIIVVRVKLRKGGLNRRRPVSGRRPKRMGVEGYSPGKNHRWIAEERAAKRYRNMEVLGSYYLFEDGIYKYYEVILADRNSPELLSDRVYSWLANPSSRGKVFRGLTSSGKKARGLQSLNGMSKTVQSKWKHKEREREKRKGHEGTRFTRMNRYKAPGK